MNNKSVSFKLAVFVIFAVLTAGLGKVFAAENVFCPVVTTKISGAVFEPRSFVFRDEEQKHYVAGNIVIAGNEYFSATIRKQIVEAVADTLSDYKDFADLAIASVLQDPDRYGRKVVNLFGEADLRWMQLDLVEAGLAFVNPEGGASKCLERLFEAEQTARSNKVGIWQVPKVVMNSRDADWQKRVQSFQLVEGILLSVGKTKSRYYLNFGENWNKDFTVIVAKRSFKRFKKIYGDLKRLAGKKIRIRGWMIQDRGPMIELFYPGQIEIDIQ